jgi:hypothetical protein
MFRISYLVKNDDLVEALKALTPFANSLSITDVPNGEAPTLLAPSVLLRRKDKSRGVKSLDRLMAALDQRNLKTFKPSMFREIVKETGLNPVSGNYYLKELIKYGCLSRLGQGKATSYQVVVPRT